MVEELLLVPGPTAIHNRVKKILSNNQISHSDTLFHESFIKLIEYTKYLFQNNSGHQFILSGSGTLGMEASVVNILEPKDSVLILDTGYFGNRFSLLTNMIGCDTDVLKFKNGKHADTNIVENALSKKHYKAICMTHVDTSTTVVNPIENLVSISKKFNVYSIVDSICGVGGIPLNFDQISADIVFTGSQKAIAAPPGAVIIAVSDKAMNYISSRNNIPTYYMNLVLWKKIMDDPANYFCTPAVQLFLSVLEAITMIKEEGLEKRWRRHSILANAIRNGIESLGLGFIAEQNHTANTVTGFYIPNSLAPKIQSYLKNKGIIVASGLGEFKGKALRIGHLGNINSNDVKLFLRTLEESLKNFNYKVKPNALSESMNILNQL